MTLFIFDCKAALQRYVVGALDQHRDKVELREEILNALQVGEAKAGEREAMAERVKNAVNLNVTDERFNDMVDWLIEEDKKGKSIELFRAWWNNENEFKRPALWKISDRPAFLSELWPSAFSEHNVPGKEKPKEAWRDEEWRNVELG